MNRDEVLSDLLLRWEELREQGRLIPLEEICIHHPELIPELQEQIQALKAIGAFVDAFNRQGDSSKIEPRIETVDRAGIHALSIDSLTGDGLDVEQRSEHTTTPQPVLATQSNYRILRSLATGGLGEVLIAHDERLGRDVALKVIRKPFDRDPQRQKRFIREAEITSRLEHPGIVPIHGLGEALDGRICYAMRLIGGESMQHAIEIFYRTNGKDKGGQAGQLGLRQLLGRFVSVCNAIAYAHSQGVIHRDIKPANIMLGQFGETLVVDWGLAKKTGTGALTDDDNSRDSCIVDANSPMPKLSDTKHDQDQLTMEGTAIGTPAYMSPEQSLGDWDNVGPASDIYSLGATLYVLLTGRAPFEARNIVELNAKRAKGDFQPPRRHRLEIAPPLESICLKAMALRPSDRYATALHVAQDIEKWMADERVTAHRDSLGERTLRWARQHRLLVSSVAASGIVVILGLTAFLAYYSMINEELRHAYREEGKARTQAQENERTANKNAQLAEEQSELALRSLQSVTLDIQRQLKNVPAAHQVRRRLLDTALAGLAEVGTKLQQRPKVNEALLVAHRDLGDIYLEIGSGSAIGGVDASRVQFLRALEIAQQLTNATPTNHRAQEELAKCHDRLGDLAVRSGSTAEAAENFLQSLLIRNRICDESPNEANAKLAVATSLSKQGELAVAARDVQNAHELYVRAMALRESYSSDTSDDEQRNLAIIYNKVGHVEKMQGEPKKAIEFFEKGLSITRRRAELFKDDYSASRDVSISYFYLGDAYERLGDNQAALDYFEKSMSIDKRQATADPNNALAQRDLMQSTGTIADLASKLGKNDEALSHLRFMLEIANRLVAADPNDSRAKRDLALAFTKLAQANLKANQIDEAVALSKKSLVIRRERIALDPNDSRARSDVANGMMSLGDILLAATRTDEALSCYEETIAIYRVQSNANPTDTISQQNFAAILQRIGVTCRKSGRFEEGERYYRQALGINEKLASEHPDNIPFQELKITVYHSIGMLEQSRKEFGRAQEWYELGLSLARKLTSEGKLIGEDATWVQTLEDSIQQCHEEQSGFENTKETPK